MQVKPIVTDVVLVDIINFSTKTEDDQLRAILLLQDHMKSGIIPGICAASLRNKEDIIYGMIPTGDGFYFLLNPQLMGYGVALGLGIRNYVEISNRRTGNFIGHVKVAVHHGSAKEFLDITERINYIGNGINDCNRLLDLSNIQKPLAQNFFNSDSWIVVSEKAYNGFTHLYSKKGKYLTIIGFAKSKTITIIDKHKKRHKAYFVKSHPNIGIVPPISKK